MIEPPKVWRVVTTESPPKIYLVGAHICTPQPNGIAFYSRYQDASGAQRGDMVAYFTTHTVSHVGLENSDGKTPIKSV
ncbi:hypothetical protein UFOVP235_22 [uncultured Caudovirales phage]|uniref:Uncharacterized protein n=1 Tax=uncultured Caudovirales phage TaxID=2100421 RepID=A0A6J7WQC8_9CAUD|nr:hypothetical protein UFOVP235_22 [uncultured Caudovirales phage]